MTRTSVMGMLACAACLSLLPGCTKTPAAEVPTGYSEYSLPDKSVACQSPNGWARSESAGNGIMSGADFTSGAAKVAIFSDLQGSLMADISRSPTGMDGAAGMLPGGMQMNLPKMIPPVEKLHKIGRKKLEGQYQNYDETAMRPLENTLGEARISEFTGEMGGILGAKKIHGLRATVLSGERRVTVTCSCPESDWKTLRPAFSTVLKSLKSGGG